VAVDADIEARVVIDDPGLGLLARLLAGPGLDHEETRNGWDRLPGGVGEKSVDLRTFLDPDGLELGRGHRAGKEIQAHEDDNNAGGAGGKFRHVLHSRLSFFGEAVKLG